MPSITSRRSVEELQNGTVKESAHNPRRLQGKMEIGGRDQEDAAAGLHQHSPDRCSTMESLANGGKVRDCRRAQDANNDGLGIEIAAENGAEEVVVDKEGTRIYRRVSVESQEVLSPLSCNAALSNGGNSLLDVQKKLSENAGENTALTSATRPSERTTVQIENPTVDHEITISTATATTTGSATATGTSTESPLRAPIDSPSPRPRRDHTLKLSPAKIHELTSAPDSLCLHKVPTNTEDKELSSALDDQNNTLQEVWQDGEDGELFNHDRRNLKMGLAINGTTGNSGASGRRENGNVRRRKSGNLKHVYYEQQPLELPGHSPQRYHASGRQRPQLARGSTTPGGPSRRLQSPFQADWQTAGKTSKSRPERRVPGRLNLEEAVKSNQAPSDLPSPIPASIPLPPFSLSTYLQLELSSSRPSPLYIHQSRTKDFPYESSRVKLERLLNFLLLPPSLEQVLFFGTLACLDSWLYTFTILPLRFFKSLFILFQSWIVNLGLEAQYISSFIVQGVGRVWKRKQRGYSVDKKVEQTGDNAARAATNVPSAANNDPFLEQDSNSRADANQRRLNRHRRTKSVPSGLQPDDKADILKGLLMIFTCAILLYFDASRMYHWIRGQAAIKLYVIYNVLEVKSQHQKNQSKILMLFF